MLRIATLLLAFAPFFIGCSNDSSQSVADDGGGATSTTVGRSAEGEVTEAQWTAQLEGTVAAVQGQGGDVTALPVGAATSNIDTWIAMLDSRPRTERVTGHLQALRVVLNESPIDGQRAGLLLTALAKDTRELAGPDSPLDPLIGALRAGGNQLIGATVTGSDLLSRTVLAANQHGADLTTLPSGAALGVIDGWINQLNSVAGGEEVIEELRELKVALSANDINGFEVGDILEDLAEETRELGGDNRSLAPLIYLLESAGQRLERD